MSQFEADMRGGVMNRVSPHVQIAHDAGDDGPAVDPAAAVQPALPEAARPMRQMVAFGAGGEEGRDAHPGGGGGGGGAPAELIDALLDASAARERGPPVPPDSEEHEVRYLGRAVVKATEENPPDGRACATVAQFLRSLSKRKRQQFTAGVTPEQVIKISAGNGAVDCRPVPSRHPSNGEVRTGLTIRLLHITTVADIGQDVCIVTGKMQRGQGLKFYAYVFKAESPFASRYLVEQVVQACRYSFMMRRMQRVQEMQRLQHARAARLTPLTDEEEGAPPSSPALSETGSRRDEAVGMQEEGEDNHDDGTEPTSAPASGAASASPPKPRKLNEQDRIFYREYKLLHTALAQTDGLWSQPKPAPTQRTVPVDRGDGQWYSCCANLGKCVCRM